jgi:hypothetical protein
MKTLSDWLNRVVDGRVAMIATALFVLYIVLLLPSQSRIGTVDFMTVGYPDLSFRYSAADLYRMAEAYGVEGRAAYLRSRVTFDIVWPLLYVVFLATSLSWVCGRMPNVSRLWRRANLAPLVAGALDLLENVCLSVVMLRYPARTPGLDQLAPVLTMTKWLLICASFLLLVSGLVLVCRRRSRGGAAPG